MAAYAIANQTGHTLAIDESSYLFNIFPNLKAVRLKKKVVDLLRFSTLTEHKPGMYGKELIQKANSLQHVLLNGYFQSWRYFSNYERELHEQLKFNQEIQRRVDKKFQDIFSFKFNTHSHQEKLKVWKNSTNMKTAQTEMNHNKGKVLTYIGVHVRRADMASRQETTKGYSTATSGSAFCRALPFSVLICTALLL